MIRGDGVTLHALYTPGHASDHLCYYLEEERALFTGDLILGGSTTVIPPDDGDLGDYLASLRRVLALDVQRIYPAHGPVLEPARPVIEGYIAHRLQREAQILEAARRRRRDGGRGHRRPRVPRGGGRTPPGGPAVRALAPREARARGARRPRPRRSAPLPPGLRRGRHARRAHPSRSTPSTATDADRTGARADAERPPTGQPRVLSSESARGRPPSRLGTGLAAHRRGGAEMRGRQRGSLSSRSPWRSPWRRSWSAGRSRAWARRSRAIGRPGRRRISTPRSISRRRAPGRAA